MSLLRHHQLLMSAGASGGGASIKGRLAGWWTFDNTMADAHGTNHLASGATPAYTAGLKGNANNNAKRYSGAPSGIAGFHTLGCSLFYWHYPTIGTSRVVCALGRNLFAGEIVSTDYVGGGFGVGYRDAAGVAGTSRIPAALNAWHFVVASWVPSESLVKCWVDGSTTTMSKSPGVALIPGYFEVGSLYSGSAPLGGLVDEMGFVVGALSNDEIAWLYNSGAGRSYTDL